MSTLTQVLSAARAEGRAALIGYLPAGYPSAAGAVDAIAAMVDAGVDVVEVGLPYSDPLMDGPTIQQAVEASLRAGTTTDDVLDTVRAVAADRRAHPRDDLLEPDRALRATAVRRRAGCRRRGRGHHARPHPRRGGRARHRLARRHRRHRAGPRLPGGAVIDRRPAALHHGALPWLRLRGLHDGGDRRARERRGGGRPLVERTRSVTDLPVCVGLGVSTGAQAAEVASFADGVIVGSAFVRVLLDAATPQAGEKALAALAAELADGVRAARAAPRR